MRANFKLVRCGTCEKELAVIENEQAVWCSTCNHYVSKYWAIEHRKVLTQEQREQIRKEYVEGFDNTDPENGLSIPVLSKKYRVSESTIRNVLRNLPEFQTYLKAYHESWDQIAKEGSD